MKLHHKLLKPLYILLIISPIIWGAFARPQGRPATLKVKQMAITAPFGTDIVFYPFELAKGVNVGSYTIKDQKLVPANKLPYLGNGTIVDLMELQPLLEHFAVGGLWGLQDELGQYSGYSNFDGVKLLSFYKYSSKPEKITTALIKDQQVRVFTQVLRFDTYAPISALKDEDRIVILLKDAAGFIIKTIDLKGDEVNTYQFSLNDTPVRRFDLVGMAFEDKELYLVINASNDQQSAQVDHPASDYLGGFLATYSLETGQLDLKKISDHKLDFLTRDDRRLVFGFLKEDDQLYITQYLLDTQQQTTSSVKLPVGCQSVRARSTLYKDQHLYINLNGQTQSNKPIGHYYMIHLPDAKIVNSITYQYKGDLMVRYYKPGSDLTYDETYFIAN